MKNARNNRCIGDTAVIVLEETEKMCVSRLVISYHPSIKQLVLLKVHA